MMFVHPLQTADEQTLASCLNRRDIYITSAKTVEPRTELDAWLSVDNAKFVEASALIKEESRLWAPSPHTVTTTEPQDSWKCPSCSNVFGTCSLLDSHQCLSKDRLPDTCLSWPNKLGPGKAKGRTKGKPRGTTSLAKNLIHQPRGISCPAAFNLGSCGSASGCGAVAAAAAAAAARFEPQWYSSQSAGLKRKGQEAKLVETYPCHLCGKIFLTPEKLNVHTSSHTGERPYTCPEQSCVKAFVSKYKLIRHMATHLPQKSHRCAHCEKTFHRKDHLKNHLQTHDPNKMAFGCEECGKKYNTKLGYKRHLALHGANSGDLTCQVCALELGSTELLLDHLRAHARGKPPGADKERKHQCDHCERRFYTRKDVRRHLVVHTGCKDFLCQFCSQRFGRKDHLTRHTKKTHPHELLKEEQLPDGDLLDLFQPRSPGLQLKDEAATPAPFPLGAVGLNVMESGLRAEVSNPPKGVCEQSLQPAPPPPPLRTGSLGPLAALYPTSSPLLLPPSQTPQDQKYEPISTSDTPFSLLKSLPLKADTKTCGTMSLLEELPWQDPHPLPKFNPGLDQVAGVPGRLPLPTEMMALADALSLAAPAASLDLAHILSFWQLPPADAQSAIGDTTMALGQGDALPARLTYLGQQQPEAPLAMGSGTYSQFNLPHILHSFASGASSTTLPHFHHAFK